MCPNEYCGSSYGGSSYPADAETNKAGHSTVSIYKLLQLNVLQLRAVKYLSFKIVMIRFMDFIVTSIQMNFDFDLIYWNLRSSIFTFLSPSFFHWSLCLIFNFVQNSSRKNRMSNLIIEVRFEFWNRELQYWGLGWQGSRITWGFLLMLTRID
jgi:hypothetical protein